MSGFVRSEGATGNAMFGMLIGILLNIILDPIFIFVFDMGIGGAAWATGIGGVFSMLYFTNGQSILSIHIGLFIPSKIIYKETLKIGLPAALSTIVMSFSFVVINIIASHYGDTVVAGNGIQLRVNSMVIMLLIGLTQGYQPFAGYNYGANNFLRLRKGFLYTLFYASLISLFFTFVFAIWGKNIMTLFINDEATIKAGTKILHAFNWCVPFLGIQFTMMVTLQATGKALKAILISLGRELLIYFPLLFLFDSLFDFNGFIFAQPIADILTTVIAILISFSFIKEMNFLHEEKKDIIK